MNVFFSFIGYLLKLVFLQYHPSGFSFATGSEDKTARMYDVRSDQQVAQYEPPNKTSGFTSCGLSLSGRFLLCGSDDNSVHIWDTMKTQHNGIKLLSTFKLGSIISFIRNYLPTYIVHSGKQ